MPPYRIVSYELNMVYLEYLHEHEYIHENIRLLLKKYCSNTNYRSLVLPLTYNLCSFQCCLHRIA